MRKENVNPDMDLTKSGVPNPKPPKQTGSKSGGRQDVNPPMDLKEESGSKGVNTGGKIPESKRADVNPDMDLTREGASDAPIQDERDPATMPGVGNMPTGKKAAKKEMPD